MLAKARQQPSRHRPRRAVADGLSFAARHRHDPKGGRGEEGFVGIQEVVWLQITLVYGDAQRLGKLQHEAARHPAQDVAPLGRVQRLVVDQKHIAPGALGEVAVAVEEHCPGLGVSTVRLMIGAAVVEAAPILRLWVNVLRRHGTLGRYHRSHPALVLRCIVGQTRLQGPTADRHRRAWPVGEGAAVVAEHPRRDVVRNLEVETVGKLRLVDFDGPIRCCFQLREGEAAVNLGIAHRAIQPLQMVPEAKRLLPERAGHFEDHIAVHQGGVEDGDVRRGQRDKRTAHVNQQLTTHPPDSSARSACLSGEWAALGLRPGPLRAYPADRDYA